MTKNHEFASDKKKKKDEYYTKVYAILPLLDYLEKGKTIWCPFDTEESNYVKVFRENGFNVISGHIADGKDFFQYEPDNYDYIISNPPYSLRESILERLFKLEKPFAMLINISGLFDSRVRFNLFRNNPFEIMVFNKRVDYIKTEENNSSPPFSSIYLCSRLLPQQFVFEEISKSKTGVNFTQAILTDSPIIIAKSNKILTDFTPDSTSRSFANAKGT